ncbi:BRO-N domain-containing protein [Streptomyces chrestomyceticus]|uniref:BRO-N domain-containing protein n=1 Tax=Streptomyces chrestomyceticus TaxID=68185 RepID=UPI0035A96E38
MSEYKKPPGKPVRRDALDINDFVYAATAARLRRLTMPDGEHWFPAIDLCRELGHTNARKALADHVHPGGKSTLENVTSRYGLSIPAGREWRRDLHVVNLQGLIQLVNACNKPDAALFKKWVSEVIFTVQRDGSYSLKASEISCRRAPVPPAPESVVAPREMVEALTRLEVRNERFQTEILETLRRAERAWTRMAETLQPEADADPVVDKRALRLTTEDLFAQWKTRLRLTEDVWAVAVYILPTLAEAGRVSCSTETLAAKTGLSQQRVHACLRFLQKHRCIRQQGLSNDGHPIYVAELPPK